MKKKIVPFFLLFLIAAPAYASSASVSVSNNVNTSNSTSTNNTTSETHIKVETNGKVTEYNSNTPGNIEVKAVNGESEIKVNGQTVTGNPSQGENDTSPTATKSPTLEPTKTPDEEKEKQTVIEEIMNKLDSTIERILSVFH